MDKVKSLNAQVYFGTLKRNREIYALRQGEVSYGEIAKIYGISKQAVWAICKVVERNLSPVVTTKSQEVSNDGNSHQAQTEADVDTKGMSAMYKG